MSWEGRADGGGLVLSGSPVSSLSVAASPAAATGSAVRDPTALRRTANRRDTSEADTSTASSLLRSVKIDAESELGRRKRKGGAGKRDKGNGRFLNANKHLMRKGILELESSGGFRTLPHATRQSDPGRPLSLHMPSTPTPNGLTTNSDIPVGGVLVAGAGGTMRVLRDQSPSVDLALYPGGSTQLAFSPDSGYGNTPDTMNRTDQQAVVAATGGLPNTSPVKRGRKNQLNSERNGSSDNITASVATTTRNTSPVPGRRYQRAKFYVGEAVTAMFPTDTSPPSLSGTPADSEESGDEQGRHHDSSSSSLTLGRSEACHPPPSNNSGGLFNTSAKFSLSPGPVGQTQQFSFSTVDSMTQGLSTPSLTSLPTSPRRHGNAAIERPCPPHHREGEAPVNFRRQRSPVTEWRERSRQVRSRSQPMVASITINKPAVEHRPEKPAVGVGGQKDYFQVTDELSRENSHFTLSEALLTVVEQYKANTTEALQEAIRGERDRRATPTTDYMDTPPDTGDLYATSPPPRSWGSITSIATEDSTDGFSLQKSAPRISLLELMNDTGNSVQSAESTAQRLLQFIATQYSGAEPEDVLTLPVDFLSSLRQDEDLQKSVTTDLRTQLVAVKKYLKTCRQAQSLTATFDGYIPWTADVHTYSIDDFLQIKLRLRYLRSLLQDSIKHVKSCPLCQGKGFVCEFCNNPEIIFPFELAKVAKCPHCQCCFHKSCFDTQPCPRCIRMRQRERRRRAQFADEDQQTSDTNTD